MLTSDSVDVLQPGIQIRPQVSDDDVKELVYRLYGFSDVSIKQLNAYDDKNYYIQLESPKTGSWPYGYVLKIMNTLDSKNRSFVDAQNGMMIYLRSREVKCPTPVANVREDYYSVEKLPLRGVPENDRKEHVVRLLTFQPGKLLKEVPSSNSLFYQTGKYIARLDQLLKGYHHAAYEDHKSVWMMESVPELRKFIYAVQDENKKCLVSQVLGAFDEEVISRIDSFEKGLIHGDFNEQNIVVSSGSDAGSWLVDAVIDFGDTSLSCYVFELSITLCYMLLESDGEDPLEAGGHVLAGYVTERTLPEHEMRVLKTCVAARLCQSLVLGAYSFQQDPGNTYLLCTAAKGWELLTRLWCTRQEELYEKWRRIMDAYDQGRCLRDTVSI